MRLSNANNPISINVGSPEEKVVDVECGLNHSVFLSGII
jgi:hypothetical protein